LDSAIEYTLWFIFSIAVGLLLLNFVFNVDYDEFAQTIKGAFSDEKQVTLEPKDLNETILISLDFWKSCGYGEVDKSLTIRYNDTMALTFQTYFNFITDYNLCHVIKTTSPAFPNCGNVDELNMSLVSTSINSDKIIELRCNSTLKQLFIIS